MDAFELLKAAHKKGAELFEVLETAPGNRKLEVFRRINSELGLGGWFLINVIPAIKHIGQFPFNFLTLVVSLEAIFLSTFC